MSLPRHGNGCYSRGCRCAEGRAARAAATRRHNALVGYQKRFNLDRWRRYVLSRARATGVPVLEFCDARGIDYRRYMCNPNRMVLWTTLDRLCCAVGVPTATLYPDFARKFVA